jgi:hypothetical protein
MTKSRRTRVVLSLTLTLAVWAATGGSAALGATWSQLVDGCT